MSFGKDSGGDDAPQFPTTFQTNTPAFSLGTTQEGDTVSTNLRRLGSTAQTSFENRFPRILGNLDTLRKSFAPGFSQLRQSALQQVENARSRTVGNLSEAFSRRRLSGSSFAADAQARTEAEFSQAAAEESSKSFLQELDSTIRVLEFEGAAIESALQRELAEFGIASGANVALSDIISRNTQFQQQLAVAEQQAEGQFIGSLIGLATGAGVALATGGAGAPAGAAIAAGQAGQALGGNTRFGRATPVSRSFAGFGGQPSLAFGGPR